MTFYRWELSALGKLNTGETREIIQLSAIFDIDITTRKMAADEYACLVDFIKKYLSPHENN